MYPRNAASPERIAVGPVVQISDGAVQTSGVSIKVMPQGGAAAAGSGTTNYEEGIVHYIPTQAETNYTSFMVIAYKASCIPAAVTVVTTATAVAGTVDIGAISGDTTAADNAESFFDGTGYAGTNNVIPTVTTLTGHTAQTGDSYARLGAPAGASVSADVAAVKAETALIVADTGTDGVVVAAGSKTGYSLTATTGLGNQTANITGNLSGSVGSVTGAVGSVTGAVGSVTGAVGSVTGNVGGNVAGSVASVTAGVSLADDAITAAKFDESTAFPLKSADTGATAVARTGADSDTLETLSDEIAAVKAETALIVADTNELQTNQGNWATATSVTVSDKTGFKLASDGLDSVSVTAPSGVATNFREMLVQVWRRFFKKADRTSTLIQTYADNGTTAITEQIISDSGGTETQGAATNPE